jgi:hypothetical protein
VSAVALAPHELLGWAATGVFVASYFFSAPAVLRGLQMAGAALWILYGVMIGAAPVIVANVLVFSAAAWTLLRARQRLAQAKAPLNAELAPEELGI